MVVATKLAMFTAGLVVAVVVGWGLGDVLGPDLTLTPPGATTLEELQHPHRTEPFTSEETS